MEDKKCEVCGKELEYGKFECIYRIHEDCIYLGCDFSEHGDKTIINGEVQKKI